MHTFFIARAVAKHRLSKDNQLHGLPEGWPLPVYTHSGQIVQPVHDWLLQHYRLGGSSSSIRTPLAYAEDLKDWWEYLTYFRKHWREADEDDLVRYREAMQATVSPRTWRPYQSRTIHRRINTILRFYRWTAQKNIYRGALATPSYATTNASRGNDRASLKYFLSPKTTHTDDDSVRIFSSFDLNVLRKQLGPMPSQRNQNATSTARFGMEIMLNTGVRISELVGIYATDIDRTLKGYSDTDPALRVPMRITRGIKGKRPRLILIPIHILREAKEYIDGERTEIVKRSKSRDSSYTEPYNLLLNSNKSTTRPGAAYTAHRMWEVFHQAVFSGELTEQMIIKNPETHETSFRTKGKYWPHCLRHTFVINEYHAQRAAGNSEPWKLISELLGHRDMETTLRHYLRITRVDDASLLDITSSFINSLGSEK